MGDEVLQPLEARGGAGRGRFGGGAPDSYGGGERLFADQRGAAELVEHRGEHGPVALTLSDLLPREDDGLAIEPEQWNARDEPPGRPLRPEERLPRLLAAHGPHAITERRDVRPPHGREGGQV